MRIITVSIALRSWTVRLCIISALVVGGTSCGKSPGATLGSLAGALCKEQCGLSMIDNSIQYTRYGDICGASLNVIEVFPAAGTIDKIESWLGRQGWDRNPRDFDGNKMNFMSIADADEWINFIDGTTIPDEHVFQRITRWERPDGAELFYVYRYSIPIEEGEDPLLDPILTISPASGEPFVLDSGMTLDDVKPPELVFVTASEKPTELEISCNYYPNGFPLPPPASLSNPGGPEPPNPA